MALLFQVTTQLMEVTSILAQLQSSNLQDGQLNVLIVMLDISAKIKQCLQSLISNAMLENIVLAQTQLQIYLLVLMV